VASAAAFVVANASIDLPMPSWHFSSFDFGGLASANASKVVASACSADAAPIHATQAATPPQSAIGCAQAPSTASGHTVSVQPASARSSSSVVPQVLSAPPQAFAMSVSSLARALVSTAAAVGSSSQSVEAGSAPATTLLRHFPSAV